MRCFLAACLSAVALFGFAGNSVKPIRLEKKGTIDIYIVEANPIVFKGKPYLMEYIRYRGENRRYRGNTTGDSYFRFRDMTDLKTVTPAFGKGLHMGNAFVHDGRIYVTAVENWGKGRFYQMESDDMVHWTEPRVILEDPSWTGFNTTLCKAGDRFILSFELGKPRNLVGTPFTMFFAESKDLKTWKVIEGASMGADRYTGAPMLRWFDGWFYYFHLEGDYKGGFRTRVARSRDLKNWEFSPHIVLDFDEGDRRIHPSAAFNAEDLEFIRTAEDINASDLDMCEFEGKLLCCYSWGNQRGKELFALAEANCTEREFCESFFPAVKCTDRAGATQVPIANSSFEDGTGGWKLSRGMHIERGFGHNGSGGLVYDRPEPSDMQDYAKQNIAVEPGKAYAFSALVKTEGFKAKGHRGASLGIEWYDANGKWMSGGYIDGVTAANQDWTLVRGVTRDLPAAAKRVELLIYITKGSSGKAYFDNIRVEPLVRDPVAFVFSSAYRNMAAEGEVRFNASIYRPDGKAGTKAVFTYVDAAGAEKRVSPTREEKDGATLTLNVSSIRKGRSEVVCELVATDGRTLGRAACPFERVAKLPERRVWIDAHKRCIVNGKPFFPLGMFSGRLQDEQLERYAKGPFNTVMPYKRANREDLDRLHAKGLMAFVSLRNELLGTNWARKNGITTQNQVDDYYVAEINKVKDHPAVLGWYVNDECPATEIPVRSHLRDVFWKTDPDHPTWAVLDRTYDLREFIPTFDALGMDPYPIAQKPLRHITDMMREVNHAIFSDIALWNVPQTFDWGWFRKREKERERFPTEAEIANMCWQHIAHGANGLISYCFHSLFRSLKDETLREDYWGRICRSHEGVKRMIPVLLSVEPAPVLTDVPLTMPARIWRKDGRLYVLVVNVESAEQSTKIGFRGENVGRTVSGIELGAASQAKIVNGKLSVTIPAAGFAIICIKEEKR